MESGDIELRREAGRSNSCCMAFFRISSKVGGGGGVLFLSFFHILDVYTFRCRDLLHYFLCNCLGTIPPFCSFLKHSKEQSFDLFFCLILS